MPPRLHNYGYGRYAWTFLATQFNQVKSLLRRKNVRYAWISDYRSDYDGRIYIVIATRVFVRFPKRWNVVMTGSPRTEELKRVFKTRLYWR